MRRSPRRRARDLDVRAPAGQPPRSQLDHALRHVTRETCRSGRPRRRAGRATPVPQPSSRSRTPSRFPRVSSRYSVSDAFIRSTLSLCRPQSAATRVQFTHLHRPSPIQLDYDEYSEGVLELTRARQEEVTTRPAGRNRRADAPRGPSRRARPVRRAGLRPNDDRRRRPRRRGVAGDDLRDVQEQGDAAAPRLGRDHRRGRRGDHLPRATRDPGDPRRARPRQTVRDAGAGSPGPRAASSPSARAVQGAAASEPAAAGMLAEMDRQRFDGMGVMAPGGGHGPARGERAGVPRRDLGDDRRALWHRFVIERGWSDERFAEWVGAIWVAALVRR